MTVYLVISLPKIPYTHRMCMVQANPTNIPANVCAQHEGVCRIHRVKANMCRVDVHPICNLATGPHSHNTMQCVLVPRRCTTAVSPEGCAVEFVDQDWAVSDAGLC